MNSTQHTATAPTTSTAPQQPVLTRAAGAETRADPSSVMTLLADAGTDGSGVTSYRSRFSPGTPGAPVHFHTRAWEIFFVISGSLQVLVGEEVTVLNDGDFLAVPPHTPHAFRAAPGSEPDVLCLFTPGMPRFDYLRLLNRVALGQADPREIAESSELYDNHYTESAVWRALLNAEATPVRAE